MPVDKFIVNEWYVNARWEFVVRAVDGDELLVETADGVVNVWPAARQAAVSTHIQPLRPRGSPWWEGNEGHLYTRRVAGRLRAEGVPALYHFTAVENLPGIREAQAICSKQTLEREGRWPPPVPGGNEESQERDRRMGNWPYVSLSFSRDTPLAFVRAGQHQLALFVIDPVVAGYPGVLFTYLNAASPEAELRVGGLEGLSILDFDVIRQRPNPSDPEWRRYVQAEVLVPNRLPLSFVKSILLPSREHLEQAECLWADVEHPPFGSAAV